MERVETLVRTQKYNKHQFYCDKCNKYLGETEEDNKRNYNKL